MEMKTTCPTCKTVYLQQPEKCDSCGYPFAGSEKDKSHFVAQKILKKGKISDTKNSIKRARVVLFILAGMNILLPFLMYRNAESKWLTIGFSVAIGMIFLFFAFLCKRQPFISVLVPLIILVLMYVSNAIFDPMTLFKGVFFKIIFLSSLTYCLINITKSNKIRRESHFMARQKYN